MKDNFISMPTPKDRDDFLQSIKSVKAHSENYALAQKFLEHRTDPELGRVWELALMLKINLVGCGAMTACNAAVEMLRGVYEVAPLALR